MNKRELAAKILEELIDDGMISLECGQVYWEQGKEECIDSIYNQLKDFYIIEGREIRN